MATSKCSVEPVGIFAVGMTLFLCEPRCCNQQSHGNRGERREDPAYESVFSALFLDSDRCGEGVLIAAINALIAVANVIFFLAELPHHSMRLSHMSERQLGKTSAFSENWKHIVLWHTRGPVAVRVENVENCQKTVKKLSANHTLGQTVVTTRKEGWIERIYISLLNRFSV